MIGLGFEEIIANVLCSRADVTTRLNAEDAPVVGLENPMSESYAALRPTLLASLLAVEERSAKTAYPHRVFEVGEVVVPDADDPHLSRTTSLLGALVAHPTASFSDAHSVLSYLGYYLDAPAELRPVESGTFLPGRAAEVIVGGHVVGRLGELHPEVARAWELPGRVGAAELDYEPLLAEVPPARGFTPSVYPHVDFDLSFRVSEDTPAGELLAVTSAAAGDLLESSWVFDEFRPAVGERAVAIRYRLRASDRTLTGEEVAGVRQAMIEAGAGMGAVLRGA